MAISVQRHTARPVQARGGGVPAAQDAAATGQGAALKGGLRGLDFGAQEALLAPGGPPVQREEDPAAPAVTGAPGVGTQDAAAPGADVPVVGSVDTSSFERWVQSGVSAVGLASGFLTAPLPVDGVMGAPVRTAVRAFQRQANTIVGRRLVPDGIVGRETTGALEEATTSSAPTVREKDRAPAPPAPGTAAQVAPGAGDNAATTDGATGGGGAPAAAVDQTNPEGSTEAPAETPQDGTEEKDLAGGKVADEVKPGVPRTGPAGDADTLRQRFKKGVLVSLTIPAAYDSTDEVIQHVDDGNALDAYAYDLNFPKWAAEHPGEMQGYWATIRAANPKMQKLPEDFATADKSMKGKIIGAVKANKDDWKAIRCAMWADAGWKLTLAKTAVANNKFIPDSAASFAKAQGAVAGDDGTVQIGQSMTYNKPGEMGVLVNQTSGAVKTLLEANPPAEGSAADQATQDDATAKVQFLTISSHGWPTGMGGHGHAKDATFNAKKVPEIIGSMAGSLAPDVRVRLFACQTSHTGTGATPDEGEGSLGDVFRDALLAEGKTDATVIGHTESGHTQENSTTRFFGKDAEGKNYDDWRGKAVFDGDFAREYLEKKGAPVTGKNESAILAEMRRFFSRECWMGDITSLDALKESSRALWYDRYPTVDTVTKMLVDKPKKTK